MAMDRRAFVAGATVLLASPRVARGQPAGRLHRIGWLDHTSLASNLDTFAQALIELGWAKGTTFAVEYRGGDGKLDALPGLAAALVRLPVEVIVAPGTPEAKAARAATATLPIVMFGVSDPVAAGLVSSLARPGGNVTGLSSIHLELSGKVLALLRECMPKVSRVAVLWEPRYPESAPMLKNLQAAAAPVRVALLSLEIHHHGQVEAAFAAMKRQQVDAVIVLGSGSLTPQWIADLSFQHRLPLAAIPSVMGFTGLWYVWAGGLLSYEQSYENLLVRAAAFVDKVLRGSSPASLPIERPTKFTLALNVKTAGVLGVTIPPSLLLQADRVIE